MSGDARTAIETLRHTPIAHGAKDGDPAKATVEWTSTVASALLDVAEAAAVVYETQGGYGEFFIAFEEALEELRTALDRLAGTAESWAV